MFLRIRLTVYNLSTLMASFVPFSYRTTNTFAFNLCTMIAFLLFMASFRTFLTTASVLSTQTIAPHGDLMVLLCQDRNQTSVSYHTSFQWRFLRK